MKDAEEMFGCLKFWFVMKNIGGRVWLSVGKQAERLVSQSVSELLLSHGGQNANAEFDLHVNDASCRSEGLRGRRMVFISRSS